jgi:hypothetical protein
MKLRESGASNPLRGFDMKYTLTLVPLAAAMLLGACTTMPSGPREAAYPGTGKTWDQFRFDDNDCRQYATASIGGTTPGQAQTDSAVKSAAVGTAVGALAGAAVGGHNAIGAGAGIGLVAGALVGANAGDRSGYALQARYDDAYKQCMYAKGNKVAVHGRMTYSAPPQTYAAPPPPPPGYAPPPPPPGYAPPPPPQ